MSQLSHNKLEDVLRELELTYGHHSPFTTKTSPVPLAFAALPGSKGLTGSCNRLGRPKMRACTFCDLVQRGIFGFPYEENGYRCREIPLRGDVLYL